MEENEGKQRTKGMRLVMTDFKRCRCLLPNVRLLFYIERDPVHAGKYLGSQDGNIVLVEPESVEWFAGSDEK